MITYKPFYQTLFKRGITEYQLIKKYGISSHILHRMKQGKAITTPTLERFCEILDCDVDGIIEYEEEE